MRQPEEIGSLLLPHTRMLGIELMPPGLATSRLSCWAISLALIHYPKIQVLHNNNSLISDSDGNALGRALHVPGTVSCAFMLELTASFSISMN